MGGLDFSPMILLLMRAAGTLVTVSRSTQCPASAGPEISRIASAPIYPAAK